MFLYGTCFPALMRQRGHSHYLHGSCLEKNGKAVLISGESGAGKSTLAAELLEHGWRFMADDVAFFSVEENSILIIPSCPIQKLWDDAVEALSDQDRERLIMSSVDGRVKYYVSVPENYSAVPAKLGIIVNLSRGEDFRFEMLSEEEKMPAVLADLMPSPKKGSPEAAPAEALAGRIAACAAVCRAVRTETRADCANIRERIEGMLA